MADQQDPAAATACKRLVEAAEDIVVHDDIYGKQGCDCESCRLSRRFRQAIVDARKELENERQQF